MKKEPKLIIANWKMNPSKAKDAITLYKNTKKIIPKTFSGNVVVCPPVVYLPSLKKDGISGKIKLGVQDFFAENEGSFTGKVSLKMLKEMGVTYSIIGHSELRSLGETDETISKKISVCFKNGIVPVLCVGETVRDDLHQYFAFVGNQLENALKLIPKVLIKKVIIAYEPVWAIGKNATREATVEESLEMSLFVKKFLCDMAGIKAIDGMRVLYGGSVTDKNAESFLQNGGVDGLLVGRASLDTNIFSKIIKSV